MPLSFMEQDKTTTTSLELRPSLSLGTHIEGKAQRDAKRHRLDVLRFAWPGLPYLVLALAVTELCVPGGVAPVSTISRSGPHTGGGRREM